jgi:predicted nucleic acid-binding protein
VPATRHALTEFPPRHLYLDTNFLLNALVPSYPFHTPARAFVEHLATMGLTTLYVSSLSWLEFGYAVLSATFRAGLADEWQAQYALPHWGQPDIAAAHRDAYLTAMVDRALAVLQEFPWVEISLSPDISVHALQLMGQYNLRGQDAGHVACAQAANVVDLGSFDTDFHRVDGLHLWTL